jgi:hypothetical protein
MGAFARAIDSSRIPLHAVCYGSKVMLGSLVHTRALGTRFLGKRFVACSVHEPGEITLESLDCAVASHLRALGRAGERPGGIWLEGAHLVSFECRGEDSLAIALSEGAPRGAVPLEAFLSRLPRDCDARAKVGETGEERRMRATSRRFLQASCASCARGRGKWPNPPCFPRARSS